MMDAKASPCVAPGSRHRAGAAAAAASTRVGDAPRRTSPSPAASAAWSAPEDDTTAAAGVDDSSIGLAPMVSPGAQLEAHNFAWSTRSLGTAHARRGTAAVLGSGFLERANTDRGVSICCSGGGMKATSVATGVLCGLKEVGSVTTAVHATLRLNE